MKVYVFDPLWPTLLTPQNEAQLRAAGAEVILTTEKTPFSDSDVLLHDVSPKILAINPDYVDWSLPPDSFKNIPNLSCIITGSTSYGWIDTGFAKANGITVCNTRNFSSDAVADWAVLMVLNIARKIPLLIKNQFPLNLGSDFETYQGMNLKGKVAGIIGLGNIGEAIAERCHGLGMSVCYWNRSPKNTQWDKIDLAELFSRSDVVFPCMADTEETQHVISDDMIRSMKKTSLFVSIVHKYYNHELILEAVNKGAMYGYAFESEPANFHNYAGNVWAAPAYAWCTDGSMRQMMDAFVQAISDAVKGIYPTQV